MVARPVKEISPTEFEQRWSPQATADSASLLDVREPWEVERAAVKGAVCIPMGEIPNRVKDLDAQQPIVVMCHSGVRSLQVAQYLADMGFEQVFNLAGGIDAWSREVDPAVPRY